jgi:hypothetical protein
VGQPIHPPIVSRKAIPLFIEGNGRLARPVFGMPVEQDSDVHDGLVARANLLPSSSHETTHLTRAPHGKTEHRPTERIRYYSMITNAYAIITVISISRGRRASHDVNELTQSNLGQIGIGRSKGPKSHLLGFCRTHVSLESTVFF